MRFAHDLYILFRLSLVDVDLGFPIKIKENTHVYNVLYGAVFIFFLGLILLQVLRFSNYTLSKLFESYGMCVLALRSVDKHVLLAEKRKIHVYIIVLYNQIKGFWPHNRYHDNLY